MGSRYTAAHAIELIVPNVFGIGENDFDKLDELILRGIGRAGLHADRTAGVAGLRHLLQQLHRIDAEEPGDDENDDQRAQSAMHGEGHAQECAAGGPAIVFDIFTFSSALPTHDVLLERVHIMIAIFRGGSDGSMRPMPCDERAATRLNTLFRDLYAGVWRLRRRGRPDVAVRRFIQI